MTVLDDEDISKAIESVGQMIHEGLPKSLSWEAILLALTCHTELLKTLMIGRIGEEKVEEVLQYDIHDKFKTWYQTKYGLKKLQEKNK
jgi:hypothetical protein